MGIVLLGGIVFMLMPGAKKEDSHDHGHGDKKEKHSHEEKKEADDAPHNHEGGKVEDDFAKYV